MKLYVYKLNDNCPAASWDDVDYYEHGQIVAIIDGPNNNACETVAGASYSDTDIYAWGYESFADLPRAADVEHIYT